jgi:hypothetical protein
MTVVAALAFIRRTREDADLAARIAALGPEATLDQLVSLGADVGLTFDADALRVAQRHDWAFRSARFARDDNR